MKTLANTNIVFFGSPAFAIPALEALHSAGAHLLVVTMPERPTGRRQTTRPTPVKDLALKLGLTVLTPEKLDAAFLATLKEFQSDVAVVAAYGKIFKPELLALPKRGFVNIHPSLLPRHRGASPVAGTILAGDTETGISIMVLDEGVDTGPVLATRTIMLEGIETAGELTARLATLGAQLLLETLPSYLSGHLTPSPQDGAKATHTRLLKKEHGRIDWALPAEILERHIRAMTPWPGAWTTLQGKLFKILDARLSQEKTDEVKPHGTLVLLQAKRLGVVCGEQSSLELVRVQQEGKTPLSGADLLNGLHGRVGERLG